MKNGGSLGWKRWVLNSVENRALANEEPCARSAVYRKVNGAGFRYFDREHGDRSNFLVPPLMVSRIPHITTVNESVRLSRCLVVRAPA